MRNRPHNVYLVILFLFIIVINLASLWHNSSTYDEKSHLTYGINILSRLDSTRFDDSKMPVSVFNAAPYALFVILDSNTSKTFLNFIGSPMNVGRPVTVLFSLLGAFVIYRWTRDLYGRSPALFAVLLYTFEPNILAHSQVITTDLYSIVMVTLTTYSFWIFLNSGTTKHALYSSILLGLSQLVKYTCVYLYPIFIIILLVKYCPIIINIIRKNNYKLLIMNYIAPFLRYSCMYVVASILIINIGFIFNNTLMPLKEYHFKSEFFQKFQAELSFFDDFPVPLPYPYVEGLDLVKQTERTGEGYNIYLMGKLKEGGKGFKGFIGYYFYAFFFKTPIALQLIVVIALIRYVRSFNFKQFIDNEIFLVVPILFFTIYFNFFYNLQIGLRHFLVAYPFLIIFGASIASDWDSLATRSKVAIVILSTWLIISVMSYFPHYIPYFNEFVFDRKMAYKLLADSNIDWGQGRWYLENELKSHPNYIVNPPTAVAGKIVVNVNELLGITTPPKKFQWLRDNFKPIDHIAYSYLVFDVTPNALLKLNGQ